MHHDLSWPFCCQVGFDFLDILKKKKDTKTVSLICTLLMNIKIIFAFLIQRT